MYREVFMNLTDRYIWDETAGRKLADFSTNGNGTSSPGNEGRKSFMKRILAVCMTTILIFSIILVGFHLSPASCRISVCIYPAVLWFRVIRNAILRHFFSNSPSSV